MSSVRRPAPIVTSTKWTRSSPPVDDLQQQFEAVDINDMRASSRMFRLAGQVGSSVGSAGVKKVRGPAPLNLGRTTATPSPSTVVAAPGGGAGPRGVASDTGQAGARAGAPSLKPLIVVLDLDETLVHSTFHGAGATMYRQVERRKQHIRRQCESFRLVLSDGDVVTVNKRPQVDAFLQALHDDPRLEPHVFTAALDSYAAPVLDYLDPDDKLFKRRMFRESCTPTGMGTFAKDLSTLYTDLSRVVLVDNNPISLMKQPSNGILVPSFFDDPKDDVLQTVLSFLHSLADAPDVRPVLKALKSDS